MGSANGTVGRQEEAALRITDFACQGPAGTGQTGIGRAQLALAWEMICKVRQALGTQQMTPRFCRARKWQMTPLGDLNPNCSTIWRIVGA